MNQYDNSYSEFRNKVECWHMLSPLAEKASRLLDQGDGYKRQIKRLNELRERAKATIRTHPERGKSLLDEATELAARAAPPGYQDMVDLLQRLYAVLPEPTVKQLEQQIDLEFPGTICRFILQAKDALERYDGPQPADSSVQPITLPTKVEIDSLETRIRKVEAKQQEIDEAMRKESEMVQTEAWRKIEAERKQREAVRVQAQAAAKAEEQSTTINDFAKRLAATGLGPKGARAEIKMRVKRDSLKPEDERRTVENAMRRFYDANKT